MAAKKKPGKKKLKDVKVSGKKSVKVRGGGGLTKPGQGLPIFGGG